MEIAIIEITNILGKTLEIYGNKEKPLFLAKDIADWIGHTNVSEMVRNLEEGTEKVLSNVDTLGGNQLSTLLTEFGVYEVLFTSRKKVAKQLRKGVKEFLRAWRKQEVKVVENKTIDNSESLLQATKNLLELSSQLNDRVKSLEDKTNSITKSERYRLHQAIKKRVYERANHLNMNDNLKLLFANFYRDFKRKFSIAILDDLAPSDLESAFEFVNTWREDKNLKRM